MLPSDGSDIEEAVTVTRWNRRLLFGAVAVLVPVLAGCEAGLNAPTLQFHPANFSGNTVRGGISLSNVFVLGPELGRVLPPGGQAGVFLAISTQSGNDRLDSVSAPGTARSVRVTGGSIRVPAETLVDLGGPEPEVVLAGLQKPLRGGQTITMSFRFARAGTITLRVPVEPHAYEYATFAPPAPAIPTPSASPTASGTATPSPGASASASTGTGSASASASPTP
jgi:copper(I)-binding protein